MAKVVVLGGGESGWGSAYLAKEKGHDTFLSDSGSLNPKYKSLLEEAMIPFEEGGHTIERVLEADIIIKSPGIPDSVELVQRAIKQGVEVISEIEFAGRYDSARRISITGSNGKTTTTSLIYHILSHAGYNVGLGGNIGVSYAYQVATTQRDWYVLELSSFQLDGIYDFRSDIALLMNVTPDHLDRYDYSMERYTASKFRIVRNQRERDSFIFSFDDSRIRSYISSHMEEFKGAMRPFTTSSQTSAMHYDPTENEIRVFTSLGGVVIDCSRLMIGGLHNYANIMASAGAALEAGVSSEKIKEAVYTFKGVEHRLEPIAKRNDIIYINDSKATNVDSLYCALESMQRPTVLILGGTDKGNDYSQVDDLVSRKVRAMVFMGVDNSKLMAHFKDRVGTIISTSSLEEAMEAVAALEQRGDAVLLSPACASFDLFSNYEDRGRKFKAAVMKHINKIG